MLAELRQERILEQLDQQQVVSIASLCRLTGASDATIRRDLIELEKRGKLDRVHGGAILSRNTFRSEELNMDAKKVLHTDEKKKIARYAASLVTDQDVVYLDGGTTVMYMVDHIQAPNATFITNSAICAQLLPQRGFRTYVLAGVIKPGTLAIIGGDTMEGLKRYNFTKAFLGTNGIAVGPGFTTPDPEEAMVKATAAAHAHEVWILADESKYDTITAASFLALNAAQIISEAVPDAKYLETADIQLV